MKRVEVGSHPASLRALETLTVSAALELGRVFGNYGLNNELIEKPSDESDVDGFVECRERLGGVHNHYYRKAA
ncbi:MAG: hypothetical protein JRH19_21575 [Deltaproteobacteria bacterium]|nr:hypothetical protein [Deltaproteobacteria bacterium]